MMQAQHQLLFINVLLLATELFRELCSTTGSVEKHAVVCSTAVMNESGY